MKNANTTLTSIASIDHDALDGVHGGAARVAATSRGGDTDSKLQLMLSQVGDSIKELAGSKNSGGDQMMPMMMMMMMMGGGGGGGSAPAPAPAPAPATHVRVNVRR
jgi:hypothetical protein